MKPPGSGRGRAGGGRAAFRAKAAALLAVALGLGGVDCATPRRAVVRATEIPLDVSLHEPPRDPAGPGGIRHVVKPGETLWRIAGTYGMSVEDLAQANGIRDVSRLETGRPLFIPRVAGTPEAAGGRETVPESTAAPGMRFTWPVPDGRVLSDFGVRRRNHRHEGLDIDGRRGQPVLAAAAGRVVYSGSTMRGYGKTVIVDHGNGLRSLYAHNSALLVRKGHSVRRGQPIAKVGRTGNASTEHCHFEIREHDVAVDPLLYLAGAREEHR